MLEFKPIELDGFFICSGSEIRTHGLWGMIPTLLPTELSRQIIDTTK